MERRKNGMKGQRKGRDRLLKGHFTHMKLFFKITEIETLINITYIVRFLRSTDVSVFYY